MESHDYTSFLKIEKRGNNGGSISKGGSLRNEYAPCKRNDEQQQKISSKRRSVSSRNTFTQKIKKIGRKNINNLRYCINIKYYKDFIKIIRFAYL